MKMENEVSAIGIFFACIMTIIFLLKNVVMREDAPNVMKLLSETMLTWGLCQY